MRKFVLLFVLSSIIAWGQAQVPAGYYDAATGTGYTLKSQLHDIIDAHSAQTHDDLWTHFQTTDVDNYYDNSSLVWDMYSDNPFGSEPYTYTFITDQCGNYSGEGSCYNREHSFPKSWFNDADPMYTDLFHIYLTDGYVNNMRGNYPFGEVGTADWTSQNGSKRGSCSYPGYSGTVFEPIDTFKGDFARAYFYMATRYEDIISGWPGSDMLNGTANQVFGDWALNMLMEWHTNDPVSQTEIDRNDAVYGIQGNRNPFIDNPDWVYEIWGDGASYPEPDNQPTNFAAVANGSDQIDLSWTDATGTNLPDGYLIKANTTCTCTAPVDGTDPTLDNDLSDGEAVVKAGYGSQNYAFTGLLSETTYHFSIWSYANSGTSIDFLTSGALTTSATTEAGGTGGTTQCEDFDDQSGNQNLSTFTTDDFGTWTANEAGNFGLATPNNGAACVAINDDTPGAHITTPAFNTVGTVSFWYYQRSGDANDQFELQVSEDGGAFTTVTTQPYNVGETYTEFTYDVNSSSSNVKIRVLNDNMAAHLIIDDFCVTDYGGTPEIKPEPTNHATNFRRERSVNLSWTNSETPDYYMIKMNNTGCGDFSAPVDETTYTGSDNLKIINGTSTNYEWSNLPADATYYFIIIPFNGSSGSENYKTDGSIPCLQKNL